MKAQANPMSFEAFLEWYPEDGKWYELIEGVVVEVLPTGNHELIAGFLAEELTLEIRRQNLPYTIPRSCLLKPDRPDSGYQPDVVILDKTALVNEPLWQKSSTIQFGKTVPLVIEVVRPNWWDDYGHKLVEYEAMGIAEYWIVDFCALGAIRHIGKPKQPTVTVCQLIEDEYQMQRFIAGQRLKSGIFPNLELSTDAIFQAAEL
ncbi:Uma2 family endonuclease [Oculatella sp. FACHB-28]|uniref:Uma2 family endonuclease n=1 Tax=Oculatella sp. FACHB-28 TaxID=2692845 RepID=UPI001686A523|nr:Uma2 family endonuclease [Oculatella sp. FACHB-28]MBD1867588.1 Uma2 family endonuclease [Cyanobacteria bacterium FACHB-471]MBD2060350.1 Uma2 family endonuclease [Oculatella sp. FACHB-28]